MTQTKTLLVAGRLEEAQADWWRLKKQTGPLTDSQLLRKVVSDYMLLEKNPVQYLLSRNQKPKPQGVINQ